MLIEWALKEKMTLKKMDESRKDKKKAEQEQRVKHYKKKQQDRKTGQKPKKY